MNYSNSNRCHNLGIRNQTLKAIVLDPTSERTKSLEVEHKKRSAKYPGFVEGVDKKYHCFVKAKKLSQSEINGLIRKYIKM